MGARQILRTELTGTAENPREGAGREQARVTTVNVSDECLLFSMLTECLRVHTSSHLGSDSEAC